MDAQKFCLLTNNYQPGQRQTKRGWSQNRDEKSLSDTESDCDPDSDPDPDNAVQADLSGSQPKDPGFTGGYLFSWRKPNCRSGHTQLVWANIQEFCPNL
jgi:hypothetical protein